MNCSCQKNSTLPAPAPTDKCVYGKAVGTCIDTNMRKVTIFI